MGSEPMVSRLYTTLHGITCISNACHTCEFVGDLAVLHPLRLRLFRIKRHILLPDALHVLIVGIFGIGLDNEHRTARRALHGELPDFGRVIGAGLVLLRIESCSLSFVVFSCRAPASSWFFALFNVLKF